MAVFIKPARAEITEGGTSAAAILAVIAGAVAISAIAAVLTDIIIAAAVITAVAVLGSLGILVYVLRRDRGTVSVPAGVPGARRPEIAAAARPAIEAARVIPGTVITGAREAHRQ